MSSKAKLNEWCLVRKARANYSVGQLPNTQLFLCVLDVLTTDGNMHTFTPLKGNTKKKLAENDAAQLALDALLQTKNEKEEYAMILQAISDAIKNPCRNANTAVIELLLEAFELSDGWINAEYFLIFQGVRAAITRAEQAARRDNSLCLKILFDACTAFMVHDPEISKSKVFDVNVVRETISIEKKGQQVFIRRNSPVNSEERELLALYKSKKTIFDDGVYDIADMKLDEEEEEDGDNKPISVTVVVLSSDVRTAPHEIKIDLLGKREGMLTALNSITAKMQCLNVMTVPLYSRENEQVKESSQFSGGIRVFTKSNAIGSLNKIASWIAGSRIVGDVIISNINLGSLKDFTLNSLSSLISSSIPSGLLVKTSNDFFSMLPTHYFPYIWRQTEQVSNNGSEVSKSESTNQSIANPYTLLFQIVSRRLDSSSLTLRKVTVQEAIKAGDKRAIQYLESVVKREELITVDILSRQNDEEENLPKNPLWNEGIINTKCMLTKSYSHDQVQKSVKNAINIANPAICKVEILLPCSLFTCGVSTDKITVTMNVRLGGEPIEAAPEVHEAVNIAALKCLHLIQDFAEKELKGLPSSVPNERMCRELPVTTCATSVSFVMKIGQCNDEQTFSGLFVGCGMIMPQLEQALMNMSVGSTETITFTADQFPSDLLLVTEPVQFKLIDKNEVTYVPQPTKAGSIMKLDNVKRFSPSLQEQRKRFVSSFLRAVNATSLADLGCGDGSLVLDILNPLNKLAYVPNLKTISALDINPKRLVTFQKQFENSMAEFPTSVEKLSILLGSITEPHSYDLLCNTLDNGDHMDGTFDVVSCIEVIEHLPIVDATMAATFLLLRVRPKFVIFTTPNHEANEAIRLLPLLNSHAGDRPSEEGKGSFREDDHKFEFSREEFKDWVNGLIKTTNDSYRAEFTSVGNLLPGSTDFGGATQIVVLVRKSEGQSELSKPEKIDLDLVDEPCKILFQWHSQS